MVDWKFRYITTSYVWYVQFACQLLNVWYRQIFKQYNFKLPEIVQTDLGIAQNGTGLEGLNRYMRIKTLKSYNKTYNYTSSI